MYKAFVSSTTLDLSRHRAEAIRALQAAGFLVDQMEHWPAGRDAPEKFSAANLDGCNLCVLLVAFRRGTVPPSSTRSITQTEYEEARRRRIDVLPFLLADGTPDWNPAFDERASDPEIEPWRQALRQAHGVGEFGADPKSLRIDAALARWVVQAESDRATRFRRIVTSVMAGFFLIVAAALLYARTVYTTPELRSRYHSWYLASSDPVIFNSAKEGRYSVARVLDSTGTLRQDTNLNAELEGTQFSLDLLANNVQYIHDQAADTIKRVIRRGAKVRFILWDYTTQNGSSYSAFHQAIDQQPEEAREGAKRVRDELEQLQNEVSQAADVYKGSIELRWNRKPLFYTMWIRDWDPRNRQNAIGHLGVHFYRGQPYWPSFRVSAEDGSELLDNMHWEFEHAWEASTSVIPRE